jgi:HEAT repeat protein
MFLCIVLTQFIHPTTFLDTMNHNTISPRLADLSIEDDERRLRILTRLEDDRLDLLQVEDILPLLSDDEFTIRRQAIAALTELNDVAAIPALLDIVAEPDLDISAAARAALLEFRTRDALDPLIAGVTHPSAAAREAAVSALGEHRNVRAIPALRIALTDAS